MYTVHVRMFATQCVGVRSVVVVCAYVSRAQVLAFGVKGIERGPFCLTCVCRSHVLFIAFLQLSRKHWLRRDPFSWHIIGAVLLATPLVVFGFLRAPCSRQCRR